jgi:hypothetical protein
LRAEINRGGSKDGLRRCRAQSRIACEVLGECLFVFTKCFVPERVEESWLRKLAEGRKENAGYAQFENPTTRCILALSISS